jgi:galactose mutarotase-like enzyme
MLYSVENESFKISVDTKGAQLMSVLSKKTGVEYIWQGDAKYWTGRAYNLFPFIGRMFEGVFTYDNKTYPSRSHGLARYYEFILEEQTENSLTFLFTDNEETKKEYPFSFEYRVTFLLDGNSLTTKYTATNKDSKEMLCAFGGHPGINVPFGNGTFEEYYLDFGKKTDVRRQLLGPGDLFMADKTATYELVDGVKLPLRHDLFDHDAIILENTSGEVSVRCDKESRFVTMKYSDYPFIGFWHACKTDAPYVCLEPWSALPAIDGKIVELENKPHMIKIAVGKSASKSFTLEFHE